jgi:ATP-dependent exoDNAse (exonuclease V) beta subunit
MAFGDGQLLAYRAAYGDAYRLTPLHPFRSPPPDASPELAEVAEGLALLRELHVRRNRRPFAETIARFLGAVRAHAGLAIWPTGEQALANVTRLMDLARRAERRGVTSFRAFVDLLEHDAERGEAGEAPIVEDGTEGVRIMTVHRAKGLEFPVVILADLTAKGTPEEPPRWVDPTRQLCAMRLAGAAPPDLVDHAPEEHLREEEEAVRLLYVAATRARDLLVVPVVGDEKQPESWLAPLDPAIYPSPDTVRMPETRAPDGCPVLAGDCVSERPDDVVQPPLAVTPGLHRPQAGEHRVVWWAPSVLELSVLENVGLKQQRLLSIDESGDRSESGIRTHALWQAERASVRADAAVPAIRVVTATEHAQIAVDGADVSIERVDRAADRPGGRRFGTLVHATLAVVDLGAARTDVGAVAAIEGRLLGATADEVAAAVDCVTGALAHPLLRRAAGAVRVARETPLALGLEDGTLVEGVVDVAFEERDGWTVVDFKTDVELEGRRAEYARQVALYARALAAATGKPARPVLLQV